jgi:uncharacterized protein (DUF2126 family)
VTLGAEKPEDSPLLRRPDLLRSLITYWQHHPVLSYLFDLYWTYKSSASYKMKEEKLYEMEIAFEQILKIKKFHLDGG